MNTETVNPLLDDFLRVGVLLALGLNFSPVPGWLHACSLPLLFLILAVGNRRTQSDDTGEGRLAVDAGGVLADVRGVLGHWRCFSSP